MADNNEARSYIAFISYRHKPLDREAAVALQKKIERFKVPKEYQELVGGDRLGYVFRDEDELPTSSSLSDSIRYALDHTRFLIVICTPDLPKSEWCAEEIRYFLETHDRDHVLAVLAAGEPEESFSPYLTNEYDGNGEVIRRVEPLAANVVGTPEHMSRPKFRKESTRIIASLIGCPFDDLWQRERRYRNRRRAVIGGIAFAAMAAFAVVVGMKNLQITRQNEEISQQNQQISEQNTELQVREAKLLVEAGRMMMNENDLTGAGQNARKALAIEDIHTEGAELLLSEATGACQIDDLRLNVVSDQESAVTRCTMTADGSLLFTSDGYGVVRAFRDREELWSYQAVSSENRKEYIKDERKTDLYLCCDESILLVGNAYSAAGLDIKTGAPLWEVTRDKVVNFIAVSPDKDAFALLSDGYDANVSFRSAKTGREYISYRLPGSEDASYQYYLPDYSLGRSFGGGYSPDGRYFLLGACLDYLDTWGAISDPEGWLADNLPDAKDLVMDIERNQDGRAAGETASEDDSAAGGESGSKADKKTDRPSIMVYIVVDLEQNSLRLIGGESIASGLNPVFGLSYDPLKDRLFFARHDALDRATCAGVIDAAGQIAYSLQTPDIRLNSTSVPWNYREGTKTIAASSANNLYIFNKNDGSFNSRYELKCDIVSLEWVDREHDVLSAVETDGTYHIYPLALDSGSYLSFSEKLKTNNLTAAFMTGGGIHRWRAADEKIVAADGKWLLLSNDVPEKVTAVEMHSDPGAEELLQDEMINYLSFVRASGDGSEFYVISSASGEITVRVLDAKTGKMKGSHKFGPVTYYLGEPLAVLPGGREIITGNKCCREDGTVILLENTTEEQSDAFRTCGLTESMADGTAVTAVIMPSAKGGDALGIWKNEKTLTALRTDQGTCYINEEARKDGGKPGETVLAAVGRNGLTVVGTRLPEVNGYDSFFAVDSEGTVHSFDAEGLSMPWSLLRPAQSRNLFALLEEDGVIRIYDADKEEVKTRIREAEGLAGVVDMCFAGDDRYLGTITYNGEFCLYDTETGERLMKDTDDNLASTYGDPRLDLIMAGSGRLICRVSVKDEPVAGKTAVYDLENFERCADMTMLAAYSDTTGKAVICRDNLGWRRFYICPIYDTKALLALK